MDHPAEQQEPDPPLCTIDLMDPVEDQDTPSKSDAADKTFQQEHGFALTVAGIVGSVLEWFDFAVYGYFSDVIGEVFFPPQSGNTAIVEAYLIFGLAFLMRPFGAVLLGSVGDRKSRRAALTTSIFLMAVPTLLMGVLPTYQQVGSWAFVLLLLLRLLQGLSAGGNLLTSLVYTCENHAPEHRGFYAGVLLSATFVGLLLGSLVSAALRAALTPEQLRQWGWRIPFLAGFVAVGAALYLRYYGTDVHEAVAVAVPPKTVEQEKNHPEYPVPATAEPPPAVSSPLRQTFARDNLRTLLGAFIMSIVSAYGLYFSFVWIATFMTDLTSHPVPNAFAVNSISLAVAIVAELPLAGLLSDRFGRKSVMTAGAVSLAICSPLVMILLETGSFAVAVLALLILGSCYSLYVTALFAWLVESFHPNIRATAIGLVYNTAQAVMGGFASTIATVMVGSTGPTSPGYLTSGLAVLALLGLWTVVPSQVRFPATEDPTYRPLTGSNLPWSRDRRKQCRPELRTSHVGSPV